MTPDHETMTDREIAREALDSNRALRSLVAKALAEVERCRENEQVMTGAATFANMKLNQLRGVHIAFQRAVLAFVSSLREAGDDDLADDLDAICRESLNALENSVLKKPEHLN